MATAGDRELTAVGRHTSKAIGPMIIPTGLPGFPVSRGDMLLTITAVGPTLGINGIGFPTESTRDHCIHPRSLPLFLLTRQTKSAGCRWALAILTRRATTMKTGSRITL